MERSVQSTSRLSASPPTTSTVRGEAGLDQRAGLGQPVDEAGTPGAQVEAAGVDRAEAVADQGRGRGEEVVRGGGGHDDDVDVLRGHPGAREHVAAGRRGQVAGRLLGRRQAPLADAGARDDPLVGGVHQALEVGVRHHPLGHVGADRDQPGPGAVPVAHGDHPSPSASVTTKRSVASQAVAPSTLARRPALAERSAAARQLDLEVQRVARQHRAAEAGALDAGEERQPAPALLLAQHRERAGLGQGLHDEHAGHDRPPREVPGQERRVRRQGPPRPGALPRPDLDHLVDEQEGRAVRDEVGRDRRALGGGAHVGRC